ncbi:protein kinase, putative [Trichomonas vaginalis G3]|uniref:non-specific serine/threonine protein kinase n=1 Tax=Trichomonas vaginalis (strain ATCC PRA-98 / G3) TaxID=412133 RepID=A2D784_TRIV3|nr:protein serine/threonine kinase protein [Trichomonas vaginalis G3]EAY23601.1 protein kinase, putative [Trichomonas vaginalis G3]KAI5490094.1 protein serine/threonine kinase protein [Trichomonas vaginalis G3]|eukprot:XP_001276849.1 protein kinase [Trichomonas vaginalis G3]
MEEALVPQSIGSYLIRDKLGSGGFSSVFQSLDTRTQIPVAIKVIDKHRVNLQSLQREEDLLKKLDHPFCVSFYEFFEDEHYYYLVMEYVEGRTIFKLINAKGALPEWLCRHVFCQLICALDYLHSTLKCVHRDIKAENIMLDNSGNIKLIDFGLSNIFESNNTLLSTVVGSPAYAPPEMFNGQKYNANTDLWSAGVVLYAMSVGKLPFTDPCFQKLVQKITMLEPEYPEDLSPLLVDLLHRMLMKDFNCRMSIAKIRDHPWFTKYRYSPIMTADYEIDQHYRIHGTDDGDEDVLKRLQDLNFNGIQLQRLARNNVYSSDVAPFQIVHRYIIKQKMKGMYKQAQDDANGD